MADHRGPGHVARILHDADDHREHENLRHKHQEGPNAPEEGISDEISKQRAREQGHEPISAPGKRRLNPVHGRGRPGKDGLKEHGHEGKEGKAAKEGVKEEPVKARLPAQKQGTGGAEARHEILRLSLQSPVLQRPVGLRNGGHGRARQGLPKGFEARARFPRDGIDGDP